MKDSPLHIIFEFKRICRPYLQTPFGEIFIVFMLMKNCLFVAIFYLEGISRTLLQTPHGENVAVFPPNDWATVDVFFHERIDLTFM
jgi:hypothetical protein